MSPGHDGAPAPASTGATNRQQNLDTTDAKSSKRIALFRDNEDEGYVLVATPRRGAPPVAINAAFRGTDATFDKIRRAWVLPVDQAFALVANLRQRGFLVDAGIKAWIVTRDVRTPDPLPECVNCATPYSRLRVAPSWCVSCGSQLELQVVRTLERALEHQFIECSCGIAVDAGCLFCGSCGQAVEHG